MDRIISYMQEKTKTTSVLAGLVVLILAIPLFGILWVVLSLWEAWAVVVLWAWFAVPIFNLPIIGYWQAVGLSLVISSLRPKHTNNKDSKISWGVVIAGPPLAIFFGWVTKYFAGM